MTAVLGEPLTWRNIHERDFYLDIPKPVYYGPTWQRDAFGRFIAPEFTLGWQIIRWVESNLLDDEGRPFILTNEQKRLLLWWYAIDKTGRWIYSEGIITRLKGWGKDPFAAVLCAVEFVGPCRFGGWLTVDRPDLGLVAHDPIAVENPRAWIQLAAVSKDQNRNTMKLFPGLFSSKCIEEHGINLGKEVIYAHAGARTIEAVTSSPKALEGGRPSLTVMNETHHWLLNNEGHEMAEVIDRNVAKSKGGRSRTLSITNAYDPSQNSVAQQQREAWEDQRDGLAIDTGILYDSIEAAENAFIYLPDKPTGEIDERTGVEIMERPTDEEVLAYVGAVVDSVRGDAHWLDVEAILQRIFNPKNPISVSRRFYYNQVVTAEDAWLHADAIRLLPHPYAMEQRGTSSSDDLLAGWALVHPEDEVVMFFDGSKSQDATALVGCRLSDGYTFLIGVWQRPRGKRGDTWLAPRELVDARVVECMGYGERDDGSRDDEGRFNVVAFWGDPSHAQDDSDSSRYWDATMDAWHRRYRNRLLKEHWALKTGARQHAVMWDMTSPERNKAFVEAAEQFVEEAENKNDIEQIEPTFHVCGHPAMMQHLRNAKEYPHPKGYGTSLWKGAREAEKKIDIAVCAVGARMLRRVVLNVGAEGEEIVSSQVWGAWAGRGADQYSEGSWA